MCESEEGEGERQTASSRYVHQRRARYFVESLDGRKILLPKLC